MIPFAKAIREHLSQYKETRLGVIEPGAFRHRGRVVFHRYILPKRLKWLNIMEPFRSEVQRYLTSHPAIELHKYFHHLNSSQAFALNLFFPYLESPDAGSLLQALGVPGDVKAWVPEYVLNVDEGTNVDVAWRGTDNVWTYCEVKLTEQKFGTATDDERHRLKLQTIYAPKLRGLCDPKLLEQGEFFANYQIMRNLWLAATTEEARVLFLMPKHNHKLWTQLTPVLNRLEPALAKRVYTAEIEHVIGHLSADESLSARLRCYAELLKEKYLLPEGTV